MDKFDINQLYSPGNLYLFPNYLDSKIKNKLEIIWSGLELNEHVFIMSSGTSSIKSLKSYAISKDSLIKNARAVNDFLDINPEDKWLASLPYFHIGGLSIYIRAYESNSTNIIFESKWDPNEFVLKIAQENINYTSLVPTQLFDLVDLKLECPASMKGVYIGGDFLSSELKNIALSLGWPIIETFGMTETSSQICSSYSKNMKNGFMEVLNIHRVFCRKGKTYLNSNSLFTCEIKVLENDTIVEFCQNSEFELKDKIDFFEEGKVQYLKPLGRVDEEIKIKGRLYSFLKLKDIAYDIFLEEKVYGKVELVVNEDLRDGKLLGLWFEVDISDRIPRIITMLNIRLPKVLNIKFHKEFNSLERTPLGKLRKN